MKKVFLVLIAVIVMIGITACPSPKPQPKPPVPQDSTIVVPPPATACYYYTITNSNTSEVTFVCQDCTTGTEVLVLIPGNDKVENVCSRNQPTPQSASTINVNVEKVGDCK